ncbi:NAD(P)H-dependent oxidoreductase [Gorillibacterium sp. CAU 1737]|uniref:NAD(P)H-dependent oxidoreductase n=1 Tax=Gorillibacterium sp. CAU 1737 TaxID=3140362 RepID=UPI00326198FE
MSDVRKQILDAFQFRHATKQFDSSKAIPEEDFEVILEAARLSPSSYGFEPWKFLVVNRQELKDKLGPIAWGAQNSLKGARRFVILLARKKPDTHYGSAYIQHMMKDVQHLSDEVAGMKLASFENFQKNNFELLESDRALFDWASKQTYIALGNMLTAAALLGIDSCPIEGFHRAAVDQLLAEEGLLDSEHFGVSVMAGFGYRAVEPYPKTRLTREEVVQVID